MLALLLLTFNLVGLVFLRSIGIPNEQFAILFDAGSKGTRLYLYKYHLSPVNNFGHIKQELKDSIDELLYCELNDGGLGSYIDVSEIKPKFSFCMDKAGDLIPDEKKPETYIGLLATAGMRLLEAKNKPHADNLMKHLRFYFSETGYLYNDPSQVKIIDGQEEGIYAFVASNYFQDKFSKNKLNPSTNGILDLGGASTQLAFVPTSINYNDDVDFDKFIFDVKLADKTYKIYSYSFLCFGTAQILTMYNTKMMKDFNYQNSFKASCYPDGYSVDLTGEELLDTPCVNGLLFDKTHEFTIDKELVQPSDTFKISGNSKKNKCRDEVAKLIPNTPCPYQSKQCSFNGVYLPPTSESQFFALGNFFEAIDLTSKLFNINLQNDMKSLNDSTYTICSMTYSELKSLNELNNAGISKKRLAKLCLENVYIIKLLELYGFNSLSNAQAVEKINDKKVNWVLGYLIKELNSDNGFHIKSRNIRFDNDPIDNQFLF